MSTYGSYISTTESPTYSLSSPIWQLPDLCTPPVPAQRDSPSAHYASVTPLRNNEWPTRPDPTYASPFTTQPDAIYAVPYAPARKFPRQRRTMATLQNRESPIYAHLSKQHVGERPAAFLRPEQTRPLPPLPNPEFPIYAQVHPYQQSISEIPAEFPRNLPEQRQPMSHQRTTLPAPPLSSSMLNPVDESPGHYHRIKSVFLTDTISSKQEPFPSMDTSATGIPNSNTGVLPQLISAIQLMKAKKLSENRYQHVPSIPEQDPTRGDFPRPDTTFTMDLPARPRDPTKIPPTVSQKPDYAHSRNPFAKQGPPDPYVGSSAVVGLNLKTFKKFIKDLNAAFVLFYDPNDQKCCAAKVNMRQAAHVTQKENHAYAAVDCIQEDHLCKRQGIYTYPTMKLYAKGMVVDTYTHNLLLTSEIRAYVENAPIVREVVLEKKKRCAIM